MSSKSGPAASLDVHPYKWLLIGIGAWLSFFAGFGNGASLVMTGSLVSSVNGYFGFVPVQFVQKGNYTLGGLQLGQIGVFWFGAFVAGVVAPPEALVWSAAYDLGGVFIGVATMVPMACYLYGSPPALIGATYSFAFLFGLQNALSTFYSKNLMRTTHFSGAVTDIGSILGQLLRFALAKRASSTPKEGPRKRPEVWKLLPLLLLSLSFLGGGFAGVAATFHGSPLFLILPAALTSLLGMGHWLWRCRLHHSAAALSSLRSSPSSSDLRIDDLSISTEPEL